MLAAGTTYGVQVAITLDDGQGQRDWTEPEWFHTQLAPAQYQAVLPIWAPNASAQFVMLRRQLHKPSAAGQETYLSISAKPSPDWKLPHGENISHLLCGYKLWVNGLPLGAGPGRIVGGAIPVDTFNLTALLQVMNPPTASPTLPPPCSLSACPPPPHRTATTLLQTSETSGRRRCRLGPTRLCWPSSPTTSPRQPPPQPPPPPPTPTTRSGLARPWTQTTGAV